jgi:hypothetical protein
MGHRSACFWYGTPPENPSWLTDSEDQRNFWAARRSVSISIHTYFSWIYQAIWDCDVSMSGSYRSDPDDLGVSQVTTFSSLTKVGTVQPGRENKTPNYNSDGTTTLVRDPAFNTDPNTFGQIPEKDLIKQRHNPCVQSNSATVYFDGRYRRSGLFIGSTGLSNPLLTAWSGAPANASEISISYITSGGSRYFYASYVTTFPFSRTLIVRPQSSLPDYGTYYDPSIQTIWPMILLGGSPATVNWQGLAPKDADQPSTHPTTTALTVDGKNIPAGTSWNHGGSSGSLSISTRWFVKGKRDL